MSDLGPVNIDFVIGGNVDSEGKKVEQSFEGIGGAARKAKAEVKAAIAEQKAVVKQIERDIKELEKLLNKTAPGHAKMAVTGDLHAAKKALEEEKNSLIELENQVESTAQAHVRLTTRVREAKDELARMSGSLTDTDYAKKAQEIAQLEARLDIVQRRTAILADPNKGFKAAAGAASVLSGTMAAGVGVASLFGAEQEKLAKIQTRLQSVMAITIGVQQVAEQLNKDSYFTVVALTKVKNAWAAANLKVATTLGITTAASKALMFTGIGVVIAGVAALISVYSKWKTKQDEKNKALEEEKRIQAELSKQISDSFGKEMAKIEAMRAALNSENISRSKKLDIVKRLRDQIPGYTAELNKEGNVIRENKKAIDDYMASLEKSLKLRAAEKELEELYSKAYAIESDPEFQKKKQSEKNANEVANIIRQAEGLEPVFWEHTTPELDDIKKRAETIKDYISSNGLSTIIKEEASKAAKEQYNAANALQKQILALQAQTANLQLEQMQESLQKRLAQIDAEEQAEVQKIAENEQAIIEAYNKAHKDDEGFTAATTLAQTGISTADLEKFEDEKTRLTEAYEAKRTNTVKQYGEETLRLAGEFADKRIKIETDFQQRIDALNKQAAELEAQAARTSSPELKAQLEEQAQAARDAATVAATERDQRVSETTASLIMETEAYKTATDEKIWLNRQLTEDIIAEIQKRVDAEVAAGKLSTEEAKKIMDAVSSSPVAGVQIGLKSFIASLKDLKKAKDDLAKAKDAQQAKDATEAFQAAEQSVAANTDALMGYLGTANFFADQAIGLLQALSKEEGDAASSAANSIGAVMDIANATMQGFQQGGIAGAAVALVLSTATKIFQAEKEHQEALKRLADAKLAQQEAYNLALMKQNELLERAQTIAGTDALAQANAYAQQAAKFRNAENKALDALRGATVQTGTKKTGLFGWGGEKAVYSDMLKAYPGLIDGQGRLNRELAQSILDNENLDEASRKALETALQYADEYEDALKGLHDYLTSVFGSLGGDLMNAITQNLDSAKDAIDEFKDYVGEAMKKLISDLAYSMFFASIIEEFSEKIKKIYEDTELSDTDKAALAAMEMERLLQSIEGITPEAQNFIKTMYDTLGEMFGISMYGGGEGPTGIKGDVAKMTEDTGQALVGQIVAMRLNVSALLANSKSSLDTISASLGVLQQIRDNTFFCRRLVSVDETLIYMKNNGITMR
ncbi:MAG: hypothetical protein BWY89_00034 [Bacteroidetes bacterium ADurb.BinA012]|jgi:hypothetical protein|nr:MAG: hypothetical protein BWY89_00034 [Bacteroidetes bacterium ADurb.BinA012]